jgi:hypothetical protein
LDLKSRKLLGNALVQCHLDYSISSWYHGLNKLLKTKLQIAQNRLVRFILDMHPREHIGQFNLDAIGFIKMPDRAAQLTLNHVFNIKNMSAPQYLSNFFTAVSSRHNYNTRHSQNSFTITHVTGPTKGSFYHNATLNWNMLPRDIQNIDSKTTFKQKLKAHLAMKSRLEEVRLFVTH